MKRILAKIQIVAGVMGLSVLPAWTATPDARPVTTVIADKGQALLPIVISENADREVKQAAADLAETLARISGASFTITNGDGTGGIALGTLTDFPALHPDYPVPFDAPSQREEYLLRSHDKGLYLIGQTPVAARHAAWDLLYRLGYRQFFPGPHWEVVPHLTTVSLSVDAREHPSFYARSFFYGFGDWTDTSKNTARWVIKNRGGSAWPINQTSHAYQAIVADRKEVFAQHPEYLCATNSTKLRVSNPDLRKLVVDWALEYLEKHPKAEVVSMEPSDGGGWKNDEEAKVFKTVTDRVITLANEVAEAVEKQYGNTRYVGLYAYSEHSPAPTIAIRSNIIVGVATVYNQSGKTPEENMAAWRRQGAMIALRDYWNVTVWNLDRPAQQRASDVMAILNTYKRYHASGVRFCLAESSNSWGPIGLASYALTHLMWDITQDPKAIVDDFFSKAFGPAEGAMREFYGYLDGANRNTIAIASRQQIGGMYRALDKAYGLTDDPGIRSRLDDLTLYTRYVEMMFDYTLNRKRTVDDTRPVMEFMYRIRDRQMVHSLAMWRDSRGFVMPKDKTGLEFNVPEGKHPWKHTTPFTGEDISALLQTGISNNPVIAFTPKSFSEILCPLPASMVGTNGQRGSYGYRRDPVRAWIWFDQPGSLTLQITAGMVGEGRNPTALAGLRLYDPTGTLVSASPLVLTDLHPHEATVTSSGTGLHVLEIVDGARGATLKWEAGIPVTFPVKGKGFSFKDMVLYVPKGTKEVAGYAFRLALYDGDGKLVYKPKEDTGAYFCVPVTPGQDGRLWRASAANLILMTVPPYLACSAGELLLPREVIEADAPPLSPKTF
jgi:hypothetical protein